MQNTSNRRHLESKKRFWPTRDVEYVTTESDRKMPSDKVSQNIIKKGYIYSKLQNKKEPSFRIEPTKSLKSTFYNSKNKSVKQKY
jgi:hypothetical protein